MYVCKVNRAVGRGEPEGTQAQARALRGEGVEVRRLGLGELAVDLDVYGWFPEILPSEGSEGGQQQPQSQSQSETR